MINVKLVLFIFFIFKFSVVFANCDGLENCLNEITKKTSLYSNEEGCENKPFDLKNTEFHPATLPTQKPVELSLDKDWWKYSTATLLSAPLGYFFGLVIHEGTHCLLAKSFDGLDCVEIKLLPFRDKKNGYFRFGSSLIQTDLKNPPTPIKKVLIHLAPMLVNSSLISTYSILAFSDALPKNKWAKTALLVLTSTQVFDLVHHAINSHPLSDSGKIISDLKQKYGFSKAGAYWSLKAPQYAFAAFGASAILLEGFRIVTDRPLVNEKKKSDFHLLPQLEPDTFGLMVSGEF